MCNIVIIKATPNDVYELQKIGRETFYDAFHERNTEENMKLYLDKTFSLEKLTTELNDRNSEIFFVALDNRKIGYLKLNFGPSQTELQDEKALEIERIYVDKKWQGKKIGQALFEKAVQVAKQKRLEYIWLGVWEENPRAIQFYKRKGFVEFDKHIYVVGTDEQTDFMMKLKLVY